MSEINPVMFMEEEEEERNGSPPQITKKIRVQKVKETVTILYKSEPGTPDLNLDSAILSCVALDKDQPLQASVFSSFILKRGLKCILLRVVQQIQ